MAALIFIFFSTDNFRLPGGTTINIVAIRQFIVFMSVWTHIMGYIFGLKYRKNFGMILV